MYKILWIDDQHEEYNSLKGQFKRNDIQLEGFKSLNAGLNELETHYQFYDGVLLDARFFENEDDANGSEHTRNIHRAKERLLQLPKKFDVFVLTGQKDVYENAMFNDAFLNLYNKGDENDIIKLIAALKKSADNQIDTQLRHQYKDVFDVLTPDLFGEKHNKTLLSIIKNNKPQYESLNELRKIVESIFEIYAQYGIIPENILNDSGHINGSSRFLADTHDKYKWIDETPIHPLIQNILKNQLKITQDGSHGVRTSLIVDEYIKKEFNTGYLYKSVLNSTLELILYFGNYLKNNKDLEKNKKKWYKVERGDNYEY